MPTGEHDRYEPTTGAGSACLRPPCPAKDAPDGLPSQTLAVICDHLLEASIPEEHKHASTALAVDWTDVETFSRPPPRGTRDCADPEASWGTAPAAAPGKTASCSSATTPQPAP
jgi:hypothetical protein